MILYHGSNVVVDHPVLLASRRMLDFGPGFYTTSDLVQAQKWADITARRKQEGTGIVSVYELDDKLLNNLSIIHFPVANQEWLEFVTAHRQGYADECEADIIIGPVANDNTMPVLRQYFAGIYTVEEALRRLLPQKLKDQFVLKTENALSILKFKEYNKL